jgi:hypothetical protein
LRKLLLAVVIGASALALSPSAEALTTAPGPNGVMLIPTYAAATATIRPIYWRRWHHHHHWHWRHHHRY